MANINVKYVQTSKEAHITTKELKTSAANHELGCTLLKKATSSVVEPFTHILFSL